MKILAEQRRFSLYKVLKEIVQIKNKLLTFEGQVGFPHKMNKISSVISFKFSPLNEQNILKTHPGKQKKHSRHSLIQVNTDLTDRHSWP